MAVTVTRTRHAVTLYVIVMLMSLKFTVKRFHGQRLEMDPKEGESVYKSN